jgi:hypothetical protein
MQAVTFTLSDLATGRWLGLALICVEARYASVFWRGASSFERQLGSAATWRSVDVELKPGLDAGPFPADSGVVRLLLKGERRRGVILQYMAVTQVQPDDDGLPTPLERALLAAACR